MKRLGNAIAFGCLCAAAAALEIAGKPAAGLWLVIVLWAAFGEFN